jgi:hypothetical protein
VSRRYHDFKSFLRTKWIGRLARPLKREMAGPEVKGESVGGENDVERKGLEGATEALTISVLEVSTEQLMELWTPTGTNRRVREESNIL